MPEVLCPRCREYYEDPDPDSEDDVDLCLNCEHDIIQKRQELEA